MSDPRRKHKHTSVSSNMKHPPSEPEQVLFNKNASSDSSDYDDPSSDDETFIKQNKTKKKKRRVVNDMDGDKIEKRTRKEPPCTNRSSSPSY
jgi:hypothetical protein